MNIHDTNLSIKDVFINNNWQFDRLFTGIPQQVQDLISSKHFHLNNNVVDMVIWAGNVQGSYSTKSGYLWPVDKRLEAMAPNSKHSWSWIWHINGPEKLRFLIWHLCHNAIPTMSLLHHRSISSSAQCSRCNRVEETFLHCIRDYDFARGF